MKLKDALAQLAAQQAQAARALRWERAARAALPAGIALGGWVGACLLGALGPLPALAGTLLGLAALALAAGLAVLGLRRFRAPTAAEARARLLQDSALEAGAFDALEDRPARLDPVGLALWRREQAHARARATRARARGPRFALNQIDPWRLRYVALTALVLGAAAAGPEAPGRALAALYPNPGPLLGDKPIAIEAWAAPAAYTGQAPVPLPEPGAGRVETPPSIEVTVRLTGPVGPPELLFDGAKGGQARAEFVRTADGAWEAKLAVPGPGTLRVVRFHTVARWRLNPAPDAAPRVGWTSDPRITDEDQVAFGWRAEDDFGVHGAALRAVPVDPPEGLVGAPAVDVPLDSPAGDPKTAEANAELDVIEHPYAGMEVELSVVVFDALGQERATRPRRLRLPEKVFLQTLARAAIEVRRTILHERRPYAPAEPVGAPTQLMAGGILYGDETIELRTADLVPTLERAPPGVLRAVRLLDAITRDPDDGYFADKAVYLGLVFARSRLGAAREIAETDAAAELLWDVAMRAEYGGAADAKRALEQAQKALAEAIARGAPREEIERLTRAMREAFQNYMSALVQQAQREGRQPEQTEDVQERSGMTRQDIDEIMREVERLANEGRTEEAQALLEQLQQMLANMEVRLSQGQGEGEDSGGSGEGGEQGSDGKLGEGVDGLSDAIGQQRGLRDETGRRAQEGSREGADGLAGRQGDIRRRLNQAQRDAQAGGAQPGEEFRRAEQAMREAEGALRRGDLDAAGAAQEEALGAMREGQSRLTAELAERNRDRRDQTQPDSGERDPLGRPTAGGDGERGETEVPLEAQRARAREIVDELRRRAQDPNRPEAERQYLRRLLERFSGS